jgi:hypothetical protein
MGGGDGALQQLTPLAIKVLLVAAHANDESLMSTPTPWTKRYNGLQLFNELEPRG